MSTSPVRIDPGSVVGPYVVERALAQGGMSVLFLAHDPQLRRDAVLKIVAEELATGAMRTRLLREARALAALDHPGIVRIYGTGEHEGTPWIAMEYVRGTDLKRVLAKEGPVSAEKALRWVSQAAEALAFAHDAGVIHRDLKPSNLLVTPSEQIKIVDFGVSKRRAEPAGDVLTSQREVIGTPAYLSPEQLEHGLADERSDVWALGCVLYELCIGAPPFGRGGSASTVAAILRDEPVFPGHIPGGLTHIVSACLRKNSFARISSARELLLLTRDALDDPAVTSALPERGSSSYSARPTSVTPPPFRQSDIPPSRKERPSSKSRVPVRAPSHPPVRTSTSMRPSAPSTQPLARAQTGRIKGTAIRAGLTWFTSTYGAEGLAKAYALSSPELQGVLRASDPAFGVIASGWYDTQCIGELLEHLEQVADPEDLESYRDSLTTAIARDNVGGIYRSLFRLIASPPMLEANAQRIWRTYLDEGTLVAKVPTKGRLLVEIRGWHRHHPTVCRVIGFMVQNVLRAIGYTALIVERTECVAEGASCCAFEGMYLA